MDKESIRHTIKTAILLLTNSEFDDEISVEMWAAALGVLEAGSDVTLNLDEEGLLSEYEQGRTLGQSFSNKEG